MQGDKEGSKKLFEDATAKMFRHASERGDNSGTDGLIEEESKVHADRAVAEREKGNDFYRGNQYKEAIHCYQAALEYADKVLPTGKKDDVWNDTQDLKIKVWCNMAQCHLLVKEYKLAVLDCNAVLVRDRSNLKALWRRSNAYMKCGDFDNAHKDILHLSRLEIGEKMKKRVAKLSEKITSKRKLQAKKQGKALRRFFSEEEIYNDKTKSHVPSASPQSWANLFHALLRNARHLMYFILTAVWIRISDLTWWKTNILRATKIIRSVLSGRALID